MPPISLPAARRARALAALLGGSLVSVLAACGGGDPAGPRPGPPAVTFFFPPIQTSAVGTDTLEVGVGANARATRRSADGSLVGARAVWTSSDTTRLLLRGNTVGVADAGRLKTDLPWLVPRAPGSVTLTAEYEGQRIARALTIVPAVAARVTIARAVPVPDPSGLTWPVDSVVVGDSVRFVGRCNDRNGGAIPGRPIAWSVSDTTRATIDGDGVVQARGLGPVLLRATCSGERAGSAEGSAELMVRPPRAVRLAFEVAPDTVRARVLDSLRVVAYAADGAPVAIAMRVEVAFPINPLQLPPVGTFAIGVVGTFEMRATGDGLTIRRPITILPIPLAPPVAVPAALVLTPGQSASIVTRLLAEDGFEAFDVTRRFSLASADASIVAVRGETAQLQAVALGRTSVQLGVEASGVSVPSGRASLATTVPAEVVAPGAFSIEARPLGATALPPEVQHATDRAIALWRTAIVGDLPDLQFDLPAGACRDDMPAQSLTIDDLLVFVHVDSIDGPAGTLARAGPCVIRTGSTAAVGIVEVDRADIAAAQPWELSRVIAHEIGHVLGIGTLWTQPSRGLVTRAGDTWRYTGPRALAFARWAQRARSGGAIALGGASGGDAGHWSELDFDDELMTPLIEPGVDRNPLSLLTLEALADLGYVTSAAAAEPFAGYPTTRFSLFNRLPDASFGRGTVRATDRPLPPTFEIDGGRLRRLPR